jgi:hypothetical protein
MYCRMWFLAVTPVVSSEVEETETPKGEVVDEPEPEKFVEANANPAPGVETSAYFPKSPNKGKWSGFSQTFNWRVYGVE